MKKSLHTKAGILASLNQNRLVKLHRAHQHHVHTPGLAVSRAGLMGGTVLACSEEHTWGEQGGHQGGVAQPSTQCWLGGVQYGTRSDAENPHPAHEL